VKQQPVAGHALIDLGKPSEAAWLIATRGPLSEVTLLLAAAQILLAVADIRTKEDVVMDARGGRQAVCGAAGPHGTRKEGA
jgi:hypothetical protein